MQFDRKNVKNTHDHLACTKNVLLLSPPPPISILNWKYIRCYVTAAYCAMTNMRIKRISEIIIFRYYFYRYARQDNGFGGNEHTRPS